MDVIWTVVLVWIGWFVVAPTLVLMVFLLGYFLLNLWFNRKQWFCKHEEYWENRSCQGICSACHKDLGFVGTLREQKERREVH